ncbi:multicopy suppressor of stt4 mutation [Reticulomyxa filosa]|uniref:Multicopy suppressor of stt4 mutation n=1 Tax=Reticulomyxa filosa TaxID=46433 RepID=X6P4V8_RETFI|nr:multicopy suppressor of stt4 mutation [Reticulomyxa filosa]|eukprot:ETO32622.1 multicopy suppressor of stt4 mutation [Reticulomyxa filosa]
MDYSLLLGIYYSSVRQKQVYANMGERPKASSQHQLMRSDDDDDDDIKDANIYVEPQPISKVPSSNRISNVDTIPNLSHSANDNFPANSISKYQNQEHKKKGLRADRTAKMALSADVIEGPGCYYMGIIDTLQRWNWNKKMERFFKIYFKCNDRNGISCLEPNGYRDRFLLKMKTIGIIKMR